MTQDGHAEDENWGNRWRSAPSTAAHVAKANATVSEHEAEDSVHTAI